MAFLILLGILIAIPAAIFGGMAFFYYVLPPLLGATCICIGLALLYYSFTTKQIGLGIFAGLGGLLLTFGGVECIKGWKENGYKWD